MAIKRKDQIQKGPAMPPVFSERVTKALTLQQISDKYEAAFKAEKAWITGYLENNEDGVEVTAGKALRVENGSVLFTARDNFKIDTDALERLVLDGTLTLTTLLQIVTVNAKKLKEMIGEREFSKIATNEPTEYLTLKADPEFKAEIDRMFDVEASLGQEVTASREAARKDLQAVEAPKPAKPQSSLAKAKAAAAASAPKAKKTGDVEADLDAILKGSES